MSSSTPPLLESPPAVAAAAIPPLTSDRTRYARAAGSVALTLAGCGFWFLSLCKLGASNEALPWYLTVGFIGVVCGQAGTRRALSRPVEWPVALRGTEPASLLETWAITYAVVSALLYVWVSLQSPTQTTSQTRRLVQFVDIQLTSTADFADRKSPLPGTQLKEELHKRQSDKVTRQGEIDTPKLPASAQSGTRSQSSKSSPAKTSNERPARASQQQTQQTPATSIAVPIKSPHGVAIPAQQLGGTDMILIKPTAASAPAAPPGKSSAKVRAASNQPLFEEVQPPELVEMIENDGSANSADVFEAGGRTTGGTGAASPLSDYIKALHKRIKSLWSPPRGQSHRAAILFRIKPNGKLAFVKLVESSSDPETDEAAIKAVVGSVTGHALPPSFDAPYLDVQYTFNYTADELHEIKSKR